MVVCSGTTFASELQREFKNIENTLVMYLIICLSNAFAILTMIKFVSMYTVC